MTALKVSGSTLARSGGKLATVTGLDEIAQKIVCSLRLVMGEWFLDQEAGVDWFGQIFIKNPKLGEITNLFRRAILAVPGVVAIDDMQLDFDGTTRALTVSRLTIRSLEGLTVDLVDLSFKPFAAGA